MEGTMTTRDPMTRRIEEAMETHDLSWKQAYEFVTASQSPDAHAAQQRTKRTLTNNRIGFLALGGLLGWIAHELYVAYKLVEVFGV